MKITTKEFLLAAVIAIGGYLLSSPDFILWLNTFNPLYGFMIYYIILYGAMYILGQMGLVIFGIKIRKPAQTLGLLMITFAFFILVNWESCYVNIVTTGNCVGVSPIYFGSEDGVTWWFWTNIMGIGDIQQARLLTFVLTPFLMTLVGALLVDEKIRLTR